VNLVLSFTSVIAHFASAACHYIKYDGFYEEVSKYQMPTR